jgi:serine/threonine protein kinase
MALHYLNKHHTCHIDLKPGNVLISKNFIVKLSDFGEAIAYKKLKAEEI